MSKSNFEKIAEFKESAKKFSHLLAELKNDPAHQKHILDQVESWKPGPNNSCKTKDCKGEVVQNVRGINSDGYFYSDPTCNVCKRVYIWATNVRTTGMAEFQEIMDTQYGI